MWEGPTIHWVSACEAGTGVHGDPGVRAMAQDMRTGLSVEHEPRRAQASVHEEPGGALLLRRQWECKCHGPRVGKGAQEHVKENAGAWGHLWNKMKV